MVPTPEPPTSKHNWQQPKASKETSMVPTPEPPTSKHNLAPPKASKETSMLGTPGSPNSKASSATHKASKETLTVRTHELLNSKLRLRPPKASRVTLTVRTTESANSKRSLLQRVPLEPRLASCESRLPRRTAALRLLRTPPAMRRAPMTSLKRRGPSRHVRLGSPNLRRRFLRRPAITTPGRPELGTLARPSLVPRASITPMISRSSAVSAHRWKGYSTASASRAGNSSLI